MQLVPVSENDVRFVTRVRTELVPSSIHPVRGVGSRLSSWDLTRDTLIDFGVDRSDRVQVTQAET